MLPAFADCPDTEVTAVASRNLDRARQVARRYGCRALGDYAELLEAPDVDAVYVPLPNALHAVWAERALRSGRHVLVEKPMTTDERDTERLVALAERSGLALVENVMFVHHDAHRHVRHLVEEGAVGALRGMQAAFAVPRRPEGDIRFRADLGGGSLWDTGVYPVRAALHLLGGELDVVGATLTGTGVDTSGAALLRASGGVWVHLAFGIDHAYRNFYELWGDQGRLVVERAFTPPADAAPQARLERDGQTSVLPLEPQDQVSGSVAAFVRAVREGRSDHTAPVRQARLLRRIREAAEASPTGASASL
jgi:predicted dehydrogenase